MRRFECDYATGAHPKVMEALANTNLEACPGYGEDEHCANAARLIRELCQAPQADVHFLVGATQTNMTVTGAALRPREEVHDLRQDDGERHDACGNERFDRDLDARLEIFRCQNGFDHVFMYTPLSIISMFF